MKKKNKLAGTNIKELKKLPELNLDPGSKSTTMIMTLNFMSLTEYL